MPIDIPVCQGEEDLHRILVEISVQGFLVLRGRCIIYANSAACKIFGCKIDELINNSVERLNGILWQDEVNIDNFSRKCDSSPIKLHFMQRDGSHVWIQTMLYPINYQGCDALLMAISDITDEERSRRIRDKERLAAIGETAVMIGHDLRNPLQAIVNTTYLARQKVEESLAETVVDRIGLISDLSAIEKQSLYMNTVVCNLLDYSRPLKPDLVNLSLANFLNDTLAGMNIADNIEIRMQMEESMTLRCDASMIGRVLVNIISNAVQAMPEGGVLDLSASTTEKYVILAIKDTGPGIPLEVENKIFYPLITGKARGMGMGLAVCKRLLKAMDGDIRILSEKCKGTVAEIKIPIAPGR